MKLQVFKDSFKATWLVQRQGWGELMWNVWSTEWGIMGSWWIRYFLYIIALCFYWSIVALKVTLQLCSFLLYEEVNQPHIYIYPLLKYPSSVLYSVEFYTSTKRVLLLFHRQGRSKFREARVFVWHHTANKAEESSDWNSNTGSKPHVLGSSGCGGNSHNGVFTWSKFKSFSDLSAMWLHAGPLISLSLFPFLQKWRE